MNSNTKVLLLIGLSVSPIAILVGALWSVASPIGTNTDDCKPVRRSCGDRREIVAQDTNKPKAPPRGDGRRLTM